MKDDSARNKALDSVVRKQLRAGRTRSVSSCPDAEVLAAYVEHTLAPSELQSCEAHLAACLGCQALVAELVRLSESDEAAESRASIAASSPPAGSFRFRWAWAGSALAAMLVVGLWYTGQFPTVLEQPRGQGPATDGHPPNPSARVTPAPVEEKLSTLTTGDQRVSRQAREPKKQGHAESLPARTTSASDEVTRSRNGSSADSTAKPAPITSTFNAERSTIPESTGTPAPDRSSEPAALGGMATPTERNTLAKKTDERNKGITQVAGGRIERSADSTMDSGMSSGNTPRSQPQAAAPRPAAAPVVRNMAAQNSVAGMATSARREARAAEQSKAAAAPPPLVRADTKAKQGGPLAVAVTESVPGQTVSAPTQWRVGPQGLIQRRDADGDWKTRSSGVKADLHDISFANPKFGWAVGQSGTVLRTTDGGMTWSSVPRPTGQDLVSVKAVSAQAASVVTRDGATFITYDAGRTWKGR